MANKIDSLLATKEAARPQPYSLSTTALAPELPARAGALPGRLQDIARNYLGARRQSGVSLLEAARWLNEARQEAKHGEWAIFLEAIGLDESRARAQIRIHEAAAADPLFADRIINGFLSETVARELLPAPPEVREELLSRETPPTREAVRNAKRAPAPVLEPAPNPNKSELPVTDAGKIAYIRRYLDQQRAAGRIYDQTTFNAAWELAREIHDGDTWRAITREIHAQTNGGKGAPVAPAPQPTRPAVAPAAPAAPFWACLSAAHPIAHHWREAHANEYHAACGVRAYHDLVERPDANHCSSCIRATWPQNQSAAEKASVDHDTSDQQSLAMAKEALGAIPTGRRIVLELTPQDCAALQKEVRMFSGSELTTRLPTIGQVLVLLIEGMSG